jgi:8-oxo-dGTP pyrophosphatase MutT (NUDIX family)
MDDRARRQRRHPQRQAYRLRLGRNAAGRVHCGPRRRRQSHTHQAASLRQPSWELPAGNATEGEDQLTAAKRELEEEAGLHADNWASLGGEYYVWNGAATQRNTVHIARGLHKAKNPHQDTTEAISAVQSFTWAELKEMIKNGELNDGQSVTALTVAGLHLGHLK